MAVTVVLLDERTSAALLLIFVADHRDFLATEFTTIATLIL